MPRSSKPMTGQPPILSRNRHRDVQESGFRTARPTISWADGNGVCYSSYRRPIMNMRPKYRISSMDVTWQFPADLSIIAWLEHQKIRLRCPDRRGPAPRGRSLH